MRSLRHEAFGVMVALGTLMLVPRARADMAPPDDYVETCTVEQQQGPDEVCLACRVSYADFQACSSSCGPLGFAKRCQAWGASVYTELYCRSASSSEPSSNACAKVEVGMIGGAGAGSTEMPGCVCADDGAAGAAGAAGDSPSGGASGEAGNGGLATAGHPTVEPTGGVPSTGGNGGSVGTGGRADNGDGGTATGGTSGDLTGGSRPVSDNTGGDAGKSTGGASSGHSGGATSAATGGAPGVGGQTGATTGGHTTEQTGSDAQASKNSGGCSTAPGRSGTGWLLALVALGIGVRRRHGA